jgi:hypothetical protein
MSVDDSFAELYKQLRGSRVAAPLLHARSLFDEGNTQAALDEILKIQQTFLDNRKATLEADLDNSSKDKDSQQLKRRQDKTVDALDQFKELVSRVQLHLRRTPASSTPSTKPAPPTQLPSDIKPPAPAQRHHDVAKVLESIRLQLSLSTDEQPAIELLNRHLQLQPIDLHHTASAGEFLVILSQGNAHVVEVDSPAVDAGSLRIKTWIDQKKMQPIALDKFAKAAAKQRVLQIVTKPPAVTTVAPVAAPKSDSASHATKSLTPTEHPEPNQHADEPLVSDTADRDKILDMGAFTQLLDAAQRSGIVPGSGMIIQVRDCEYRLGKYNKALQMMETLYTSFIGAETQRLQRLQREEIEITSGRKKMTQRELQAKRIMDLQNTQAIDRAKVRFQRVLEGLRGLLPLESHLDDDETQ